MVVLRLEAHNTKNKIKNPAKRQGEQTAATTSTDHGDEKRTASSYRRCSSSSIRLEAMWYILGYYSI